MRRVEVVEHRPDHLALDLIQLFAQVRDGPPTGRTGVGHHQDAVAGGGQDQGVRDRQHGRSVQDHEVRDSPHLVQQVGHLVRAEQVRRVGSHGATGQDAQGRYGRRLSGRGQGGVSDQDAGYAAVVAQVEEAVEPGLPQVARDRDHMLARLRQRHRQVGGRGGLSFSCGRAGDGQHLEVPAPRDELKVGSQRPVGLGGRTFRLADRRQLGAVPLLPSSHLRDDRQDRRPDRRLQVAPVSDPLVQALPQEGQSHSQGQAHDQGQGSVANVVGAIGRGGQPGRLHDLAALGHGRELDVEVRELLPQVDLAAYQGVALGGQLGQLRRVLGVAYLLLQVCERPLRGLDLLLDPPDLNLELTLGAGATELQVGVGERRRVVLCRRGVRVREGDGQYLGAGLDRNLQRPQQVVGGAPRPCLLDHHGRHRVRRRQAAFRLQVDGGDRLDTGGDGANQHARLAAVHGGLTEREGQRRGDGHACDQSDGPLPPAEHRQVLPQIGSSRPVFGCLQKVSPR